MDKTTHNRVIIIGGGLAGSEAAWQLVKRGVPVTLYEMRPKKKTHTHRTGRLAELVCSNSLRGAALYNAVGLLKEELRRLGSLMMEAADATRVPAGGALAVDRDAFSKYIDAKLRAHPLVTLVEEEALEVPEPQSDCPVIVATGPLTAGAIANSIKEKTGREHLEFYDAISPIILGESIDTTRVFRQSRYEKGGSEDYLNIPLTPELYYQIVEEIDNAEKFAAHKDGEGNENIRPFEGCMPIEDMVERGPDTLLYGPLKPVGLVDPATGKRPFAVVQLRQDDREGKLWSMVGMQTRLKQQEQLRIFRKMPGLENAEFVRLGSVHRNSFIDSPMVLTPALEMKNHPGLFFGGQITGVEGYVESTAAGFIAGINVWRKLTNQEYLIFPRSTAIGALIGYVTEEGKREFQPMNISFGLFSNYSQQVSNQQVTGQQVSSPPVTGQQVTAAGSEEKVSPKSQGSKNVKRQRIADESLAFIDAVRLQLE